MFCLLAYLRHCLPGRIRRALDELPQSLDEAYERTLEDIGDQNWEYAHRLFQCVAAASRPLRVEELAEFFAFDFIEASTPEYLEDWRPEDPAYAVLSTCSSLLAVVNVDDYRFIQFTHFSVKEYLASTRLSKAKDTVSRFHISMTSAHTIVAQACLGVLLHLDENVTKDSLKNFPLAKYAAEHWVGHVRFEGVSRNIQDGVKCLFDPRKRHLSTWIWIHDSEGTYNPSERPECPPRVNATPLHYAASCGIHDVIKFLILERSQDVNAWAFYKETPLGVACRNGHSEVARVLLECNADTEIRDVEDRSPLERASSRGHIDIVRVLLDYGADAKAQAMDKNTPLHFAFEQAAIARMLLERGANANARNGEGETPLHRVSEHGCVEGARVLLEHGADANARDNANHTPLFKASRAGSLDVARLLIQYDADIHALDDGQGQPTFNPDVMQLLSEHGFKWED